MVTKPAYPLVARRVEIGILAHLPLHLLAFFLEVHQRLALAEVAALDFFLCFAEQLAELVEGAVLEATGEPGEILVAQVRIVTPARRRFLFRTTSSADASGLARVRVPYSTDPSTLARASGLYTVRFGGSSWRIRVPEAAVREGVVIRLPATPETGVELGASPGPGE